MLNEKKLNEVTAVSLDWPWCIDEPEFNVWAHELSGSGGYSEHIFKYAAEQLFGIKVTEPLDYKHLRNPDFKEVLLEQYGKVLLRFAIANGFRNIQNLVQKLKRGKSAYHYVEVMACPSGCLNGGAQIRPDQGIPSREIVRKLEQFYSQLPQSTTLNNNTANDVYKTYFDGANSDKTHALLHTNYHAVEKMNTALNIKW